jgi:hypothetical protein
MRGAQRSADIRIESRGQDDSSWLRAPLGPGGWPAPLDLCLRLLLFDRTMEDPGGLRPFTIYGA